MVQARQDHLTKKVAQMDERVSRNFSTMFDALSRKIEESALSRTIPAEEGPTNTGV